jgi:hypothetical protein
MTTLQQRIATDSRYLLASFPVTLVTFPLVVAGVSAGLGAAVVFVGLPVLAATAALARNVADAERAELPGVLGRPVGRPRYREAPEWAGWFRRMMNPLLSGQAAWDVLHAIAAFPLAIAGFVVAAVWWTGTIAGLTFPLYGWILAGIPGAVESTLPDLLGFTATPATFVVWHTVLGLLFAATLMPVLRGAALVRASLAEVMLTRPVSTRPVTAPHIVDPRFTRTA